MGEHTDYNAGLCLPIALPHRTFAACAPRTDGRLAGALGAGRSEAGRARSRTSGPGPPERVVRLRRGRAVGAGRRPATEAAGPGRVGRRAGARRAPACRPRPRWSAPSPSPSTTWPGSDLGGSDDGRARLATACDRRENVVAGAPTGGMDQAASLRCTAGHALLLDCRDGSHGQVPLDLDAAGWPAGGRHPGRAPAGRRAVRRAPASRASGGGPRAGLSPACARSTRDGLDAALRRALRTR